MRHPRVLLVAALPLGACSFQIGGFSSPKVWVDDARSLDFPSPSNDRIEISTHNGGLSSTAGHCTMTRRSMTVHVGDSTRTTVETHNGGISVR